jgi:trimethylamine--corrinoid protein Co-methyltransferase
MFAPLENAAVEKIHRHSLKILAETGIEVASEKAVEILRRDGASAVSKNGRCRVTIPAAMVEKALAAVPRAFTLYGRKTEFQTQFVRGKPPLFGPSGVPHLIFDPETGRRREAQLQDFIALVKLLDGLAHVDFISAPCTFTDVPEAQQDLATFLYLVSIAKKPFGVDFSGTSGFRQIVSLVGFLKDAVFNGNDFVQFGFCPVLSPLRLDDMGTGQLIDTVRAGIPAAPITMAQTGVSGPATLAGTLTVMNAEILSLIVLSQAAKAGAPILYGTIPGTTDFREGVMLTASPELALLNAAATQMADYYHLPNWATAGRTDSKSLDVQAGYEQAFPIPWVALAGATYISAVGGFLQSVNVLSYEKFVIDDEIVGMVKRLLAGIDTDEAHCAVELISAIGPGGSYLAEHHTVEHMRTEFFSPAVSETSYWDSWIRNGKPTAEQRARLRAREIIASHSTTPFADDVTAQIKDALPDIFNEQNPWAAGLF